MTAESGTGNVELELKLALPRQCRDAIERLPAFQAALPQHLHEITTYFDTTGLDLRREGVALRVRRRGDRLVQTLKTSAAEEVASNRGEWEWDVESDLPDIGRLRETPRADLVERLDGTLRPVFRTDIARTTRILDSAGARVEVALDEGQIIAGDAREPVSEIELELKSGSDPGALYRLALDIHAHVPLSLAGDSKAARGYRLFDGGTATARKAARVQLTPGIIVADGFRRITANGLAHLVANMSLAERGDPEGIHQVRVACRRLRAALVLFKKHLDPAESRSFGDALRELGRVLGAARDWDVFVLETLADAARERPGAGWPHELERAAEGRREEAHADAASTLQGPDVTRLVLSFAAWVEDGVRDPAQLGDKAMRKKLRKIAPEMLDRVDHKVRVRGREIEHLGEEQLHRLRKALKKLRYDAEFFEGLYEHQAVKQYRKHCERLQELLGRFNDARMTVVLVDRLAERDGPSLAAAAETAKVWAEARRDAALAELGPAWDDFQAAELFWK